MSAYADIAFADSYFSVRYGYADWADLSDDDKNKLLLSATDAIDHLAFVGCKTDPDQANEWPRDGDTTTPDDILKANCELAYRLATGVDIDQEVSNLGVVSEGLSSARITYDKNSSDHIRAGIPSWKAWIYLVPYLVDPRSISWDRVS